jgi:enoyl-CoA hydratase
MTNLYDMPPEIQVSAEGPLRLITLNRPDELNASTTDMLAAFPRLFSGLAADPEARVAILTGAGRAFSAGGDFLHFVKTLEDADFARAVLENARRTIHAFIDLPIPIIAAVNGPAVGWGATLATLCDIVLMSEKSFLAEPHINIGLVLGDGISVSWPLYMSLLRAKELIFTGDRISPQQAVDFGLANRAVPADELMEEARKLAGKLLAQPRQALRETKKILNLYLHQNAAHILDTTLARQLAATLGTEHRELARALIDNQKRSRQASEKTPGGGT